MNRYILIATALFIVFIAKSENAPVEINTKIQNVTVYLKGAQVIRKGNATLPAGTTQLRFSDLTSDIDERSIKVKGEGNFIVMAVAFQVNYLKEQEKAMAIEELLDRKELLTDKINIENDVLSVYQQEESVLMENKKLGGDQIGVQVSELKDATNFYRVRLLEIKSKQTEVKKNIRKLNEDLEKINNQLKTLSQKETKPTGEILVTVSSKTQVNAKLILSYQITQAGWIPSYDVRVKDITQPLSLFYKANVFQQSGEDWNNIKLKLSTADPSQGGVKPILSPKLLAVYTDYYKGSSIIRNGTYNPNVRQVSGRVTGTDGGALPGVAVTVKGTSLGTTTNVDGNYSISIPANSSTVVFSFIGYQNQEVIVNSSLINVTMIEDVQTLHEVVVTGYLAGADLASDDKIEAAPKMKKMITPVETAQVQNTTSVEFDIKEAYFIPSSGKHFAVEMEEYEIPVIYEYHAVPKLEKDAFLTAKVTGWEELNLLQGEANLFFEDTYVGKSLIDPNATDDTLSLSLGRDKNISIERKEVKNYTTKQFIGSNKKETRGFEIIVRNKKAQPVNIIIEDQIPVSTVKEIEVEPLELSKAKHEKESGKLTWHLSIKPSDTNKIELKYEVKYPKDLRLSLD